MGLCLQCVYLKFISCLLHRLQDDFAIGLVFYPVFAHQSFDCIVATTEQVREALLVYSNKKYPRNAARNKPLFRQNSTHIRVGPHALPARVGLNWHPRQFTLI